MNYDMVGLRRAVDDDSVEGDIPELHPDDREIINLYGYSMVWHGLGLTALNHFIFKQPITDRLALVIGLAIPVVFGAAYVVKSHRVIARYLTNTGLMNGGSVYKSVIRAPPADDGDEE